MIYIYVYDYVYNIYICIIYPILILVQSSPIDSIDLFTFVHLATFVHLSLYVSIYLSS